MDSSGGTLNDLILSKIIFSKDRRCRPNDGKQGCEPIVSVQAVDSSLGPYRTSLVQERVIAAQAAMLASLALGNDALHSCWNYLSNRSEELLEIFN